MDELALASEAMQVCSDRKPQCRAPHDPNCVQCPLDRKGWQRKATQRESNGLQTESREDEGGGKESWCRDKAHG